MDRFYVTTPIYYVNDRPHIGHAYSTIAADVLARFWRLHLGEDKVWFLTGTDEHGGKIEQAAQKAGKSPQAFCDEISGQFKSAWEKLGLGFNDFIRTTEPRHEKAVTAFLLALRDAKTPQGNSVVFEGEYSGLYCTGHEAFLKESDLVKGLCPDHKTKPELIKEKNWFFKLSDFTPALTKLIESDKIEVAPVSRKHEVLSFLKQGLEDIAISRPQVKWGIPLPYDTAQTIYVWVDALINYISAVGYGDDRELLARWWPADLHIIGKDIIKFHCVIWPALLMAVGLEPPRKIFAHGFFTVRGQKISKTIGNVVDPLDIASRYGSDALRYFLLREISFGEDGDFSEEKLKQVYNGELANMLGNYVSRITALGEKFGEINISNSSRFDEIVKNMPGEFIGHVKELRFGKALDFLWNELKAHDKEIQDQALWHEKDKKVLQESLLHHAAFILWFNHLARSFLPETFERIRSKFIFDSANSILIMKKSNPIFPRVES